MYTKAIHRLLIAILGVTVLWGMSAVAQQSAPPSGTGSSAQRGRARDSVAMRLERMSQRLGLTDDQKSRLTPILQNDFDQARAIRQDTSLTRDQRRAKLAELRQSTRAQIEPILTDEQRAKFGKAGMRGKGMGGGHRGMGMDPSRRLDRFGQGLNLTDEQKAKLQPLFEQQRTQMQALRQDTSLTPEQKRTKMKELRDANHQKVMAILTPEQQQKMQQMFAKHGRKGMDRWSQLGRMVEQLNLSDEQKSKLQPLFEQQRTQMQALRQDTSLTPEQKRTKMKELRDANHQQVMAILTPEQQQNLESMRAKRPRRGYGTGMGPDMQPAPPSPPQN
ncbi:MAG TPA: hypothetical protein VD837_10720 [Terriglobales bacterium]|nr:hypothetical protein [Terriglobales bacterium]